MPRPPGRGSPVGSLNCKPDAARPLKALLAKHSILKTLLEGLAEARPICGSWRAASPRDCCGLLNADPDEHLAALLAGHGRSRGNRDRRGRGDAAAAPHEGGSGAADRARRYRRRLAGDAGDARAHRSCRYRRRRRRRALCWPRLRAPAALRRKDKARPQHGSGYIVLAMGKMGAFELNYSSDIDLIVFYDPAAPAMPKDAAHGAASSCG